MGKSIDGVAFGFGAYFLWGILPFFWKYLGDRPAEEIICHRAIWSFLLVSLILWSQKGLSVSLLRGLPWKTWGLIIAGALCIGLNWLINVSAVNSGRILECSLGYYMNPIFSLFLGVFFLKERLRKLQVIAVMLAGCGVGLLIFLFGETPWIAISLTVTFGFYGLFKKIVRVDATLRLWVEVCFLSIAVMPYLIYLECSDSCHFIQYGLSHQFLLACSGVATVLPLAFFALALNKVQLSTIGILQFIAPTLQFMMGVFVFKEKISPGFFLGFLFIWTGIAAYALDGLQHASACTFRKINKSSS